MAGFKRIKDGEDGFTLVELLASLAIAAVLASAIVPSMAGFIGEAERRLAVSEARRVYVAAQAVASASRLKGVSLPDGLCGGDGWAYGEIEARLEGRVPDTCRYRVYLEDGGRRVGKVVYESGGCRVELKADEETVAAVDE